MPDELIAAESWALTARSSGQREWNPAFRETSSFGFALNSRLLALNCGLLHHAEPHARAPDPITVGGAKRLFGRRAHVIEPDFRFRCARLQ
jgi:hypothetical protein